MTQMSGPPKMVELYDKIAKFVYKAEACKPRV